MDRHRSAIGKKRTRGDTITFDTRASSSLSPAPDDDDPPRVKKPKRAETRSCPACSELIPIRLLAAHAELEMQRVEDIIKHIGDAEVLAEVADLEEGPSANKRRSALKARQSLTALQPLPRIRPSTNLTNTTTTTTAVEYAIGYITRRRKARHARLKELAKEEATWLARHSAGDVGPEGDASGMVCPVCSQPIRGDRDVVEAHVDACLAYESRRTQVEREREQTIGLVRENEDANVDVDVDTGWDAAEEGSVRTRVITNAGLRGTGIHIRASTMDTEDDIDIDGTDVGVFGDAQFEEADVTRAELEAGEDVDVVVVESVGQRSNRERQPQDSTPTDVGSLSRPRSVDEDTDKSDLAILTARERGDDLALIAALEAKLNAIPAVLAHVLCDMLAKVPWCNETLPNVPADYGGI
ncbi:hypothetical protein J3R82DRAFT_4165 [Butyriboletus roseoflavus]|nr:hypothetical protein J3R82DRAFT_4165 [Butyriboletus roseoflavus]